MKFANNIVNQKESFTGKIMCLNVINALALTKLLYNASLANLIYMCS